jgi:hypothetical protein
LRSEARAHVDAARPPLRKDPAHTAASIAAHTPGTIMNLPIALALIVVGALLLLFGLNSMDSIQNAFSRLFSGHLTDRTMWLIIGGSLCFVAGVVGCFRSSKARA